MLETEKLNKLFSLLEEITQSKINYPKLVPPRWMQFTEKYSIRGFVFISLLFVVLVVWQRLENTLPEYNALLAALLILQLFGLSYAMISVALAWWHRKQHFSTMLAALKIDLHSDAKLITDLWEFDKATLAYGLLQYRHSWMFFENRIALMAGDLRKIGLFPAFAAVSISAATLYKEDSNPFLWCPVIAAAILYIVAVNALISLKRPQLVIKLLEYAIQHADQ